MIQPDKIPELELHTILYLPYFTIKHHLAAKLLGRDAEANTIFACNPICNAVRKFHEIFNLQWVITTGATMAATTIRESDGTEVSCHLEPFSSLNPFESIEQPSDDHLADDDDYDRRGPRRRFDAPPHVRVRRQLLTIAENAMRPWHEEVQTIGTLLTDNWDDEQLRTNFVDLVLQLALEQPLKTPFVAAVVLVANGNQSELGSMLFAKLASDIQAKIVAGEWRDVKLYLKLLACLQGALDGDGVFPILEELFARAGELQTASSEDVSQRLPSASRSH